MFGSLFWRHSKQRSKLHDCPIFRPWNTIPRRYSQYRFLLRTYLRSEGPRGRLQAGETGLDAVVEMWEPPAWLHRQRRSGQSLFNAGQSAELIEVIPFGNRVAKAGALLLDAEQKCRAGGLGARRDRPDVAGIRRDCRRQLTAVASSTACSAIRKQGKHTSPDSRPMWSSSCQSHSRGPPTGALPSGGGFLDLCAKHRTQLRSWNNDTLTLLNLRCEAEAPQEIGIKLLDDDPEDDAPF